MNVLSLCSGVGGLDLGVKQTVPEVQTIAYCEIDPFCQDVLLARMADGLLDRAPIFGDLRHLDARGFRGVVDGVIGGYPCQPFSVAGKRRGAADDRHLWPAVARIMAECQPTWGFFENVDGHLRLGFQDVAADLERLGYCVSAGLFTAAEVGAPHRRQRLFVLVHRLGARWPTTGERCDEHAGEGSQTGSRSVVAHGESLNWSLFVQRRRPHEASAESGGRGDCWPPWPPGPMERDQWAAVLERWPDLAPASEVESAVRRVVDESALFVDRRCPWCGTRVRSPLSHARQHRLRALGNAIVPAQATLAFLTLLHQARENVI